MRVNRSSQVEGAFGVIKQDFQYERFRRCSLAKVSLEFMLVCLGYNIRKLFVIIMEKLNLIVGKFLKILHRKDLRNQVLKGYQKKLLRLRKNLLIKKLKIIINTQNKKGCKSRN